MGALSCDTPPGTLRNMSELGTLFTHLHTCPWGSEVGSGEESFHCMLLPEVWDPLQAFMAPAPLCVRRKRRHHREFVFPLE